jgi:hypothetical protein
LKNSNPWVPTLWPSADVVTGDLENTNTSPEARPGWRFSFRWEYIAIFLAILLIAGIRFRLRDFPLERDEGEYAYAGQLILQGIPPYELAYNMKLPGTYAAYAAIMAVFGQTSAGIHLGVILVNAAGIFRNTKWQHPQLVASGDSPNGRLTTQERRLLQGGKLYPHGYQGRRHR